MEQSSSMRVLVSTYFSFTTLSTVGLGDYYPVSDIERFVGSFVLLFGVAIFSYMMGELLIMINQIKTLDHEIAQDDEADLENFFTLLRMFNDGNKINMKVQDKIRTFLEYKWINDKNQFLINKRDQAQYYSQMPTVC